MNHTLPPEVILLIFQRLSSASDIKSLRLTHPTFSPLGESTLFYDWHYTLHPRQDSLLEFEAISLHPRIPRYMTDLVCETGVLSETDEYRVWKAAVIQERFNAYGREHVSILSPWGTRDLKGALDFHNGLDNSFGEGMEDSFRDYREWLDLQALRMCTEEWRGRLKQAMMRVRPRREYRIGMRDLDVTLEEVRDFQTNREGYRRDSGFNVPEDKRTRIANRRAACLAHLLQYLDGVSNTPDSGRKRLNLSGLPMELLEECFYLNTNTKKSTNPPTPKFIRFPPEISWDYSLISTAWQCFRTTIDLEINFRLLPLSDWLKRPTDPTEDGFIQGLAERQRTHYRIIKHGVYRKLVERFAERLRSPPSKNDDTASSSTTTSPLQHLNLQFSPTIDPNLSQICLGYIPLSRRTPTPLGPPSPHIFHNSSQTLRSLTLTNFLLNEPTLMNLLFNSQTNLTSLKMVNGTLQDNASLINILHILREYGGLESVCIEGMWPSTFDGGVWCIFNEGNFGQGRNRFDGAWPGRGLKWRVERWVLAGKRKQGLGEERVGGDEECPLRNLEDDPEARRQWDLVGDESWQFQGGGGVF